MQDRLDSRIGTAYLRISTEEQRRGHSLDNQREDCERVLLAIGCQRRAFYQDVESAWKPDKDREQYDQLMKDAEVGRFQVLVVWKVDRFSRQTLRGLRDLWHLVDDLGIELQSVMERIDTKSAEGRRQLRNLVIEAEY